MVVIEFKSQEKSKKFIIFVEDNRKYDIIIMYIYVLKDDRNETV